MVIVHYWSIIIIIIIVTLWHHPRGHTWTDCNVLRGVIVTFAYYYYCCCIVIIIVVIIVIVSLLKIDTIIIITPMKNHPWGTHELSLCICTDAWTCSTLTRKYLL
jgi:hypothetical protein